jgi:hypothetical protein
MGNKRLSLDGLGFQVQRGRPSGKALKAIPYKSLNLNRPWDIFDIRHELTSKELRGLWLIIRAQTISIQTISIMLRDRSKELFRGLKNPVMARHRLRTEDHKNASDVPSLKRSTARECFSFGDP